MSGWIVTVQLLPWDTLEDLTDNYISVERDKSGTAVNLLVRESGSWLITYQRRKMWLFMFQSETYDPYVEKRKVRVKLYSR